jgi:cell division topological specificity factor
MNMNLLRLFNVRKASAPVARERLQILLAHERGLRGQPDLLATLREEILAVVSRHIQLDPDKVTVRLDRGTTVSTLEVDIEVPNNFEQTKIHADRRLGAV